MLSLCYDGGKRGTCSGSVLVVPFMQLFTFFMDHCGSLPQLIATVAATPI